MKNSMRLFSLAFLISSLSSCSVVTGIFKVGMGVGAFIVAIVVIMVIVIILRLIKK